ncbi:hypothetical protein [Mycolicibacterium fortuitum]|uniref:Uncharacterized protein n=1 Tax=Mycolicibacterium fortuitum TaxID=1766 RepID=A0AAE4VGM1_MYCFO|nr:hypothetical protein [Mycolicibacterium fortuitum]MDV7195779.1 hypothetical protein [Mycolicibacterium fortuitum]MDV7207648.1 hypothetical protein [Mycolicibacterium fortuitum]MDV7229704.1 hypothetical protein [Mycolicibacterium fortuitum]MDV7261543.1 hypothetical protein [Mycolicibacterium fortuitum]MDV7286677.1 hypothetical protein [Mycolicibacterium fortuitum]
MSIDYSAMSDAELTRAAIRELFESAPRFGWSEDDLGFALGQLYAGTIQGNPESERVWQEETAPDQAEVRFHLEGEGVSGHGTRADQLADFVGGINKATKAIVRDRLSLTSLNRNLIIEGVLPGSVNVVLRADTPLPTGDAHMLPDTDGSSPDSVALRTVARIFTTASSEEPAVGADLRTMPRGAKTGLKKAVEAARKARWEIDGQIRQRGYGASDIALSQRGAAQLLAQLKEHEYTTDVEWVLGRIEGFRGSLGKLYLIPAAARKPVPISVPDPVVLKKVRRLAAVEGAAVRAHVETVSATDDAAIGESRTLLDIEPAPDQAAMLDADGNPQLA